MRKIRVIALFLALVLSLAACGGGEPTSEQQTANVSTENNVQEEETSDGATDDQPTDKPEEAPDMDVDLEVDSIAPVQFEETTVVDNDQCSIIITGIEEDNIWGYTLKAFLENKSSDKTYMFSVVTAAINGVETDPLFATEVSAGKKANEDISFSDTSFTENGISQFTDIELTFRVYDSDDWMADSIFEDSIHLYPYGQDAAEKYVREAQETDNVIAENEFASVIVTGYSVDPIWGYTVELFIINKTSDHTLMFSVDDAAVNGYMADPFFATTVGPGNCSFKEMSFSDTTLAENGITDIEEITFSLRAYDADEFGSDDFLNGSVTLNP